MREHLQTFLAEATHLRAGEGVPRFVEAEFQAFLTCGWPPSPIWQWATGAELWFLAVPPTGFVQLCTWLFAPPVRWPGRIVALVFTLPTLFAAFASIGTLFGRFG